jgi:mannose-6-phosphate isomerase-like protein (cupin superfamily)
MPAVNVVHAPDVEPLVSPRSGLAVRPTLGPGTDFDALEQAVLECAPGARASVSVPGEVEETMFVLEGEGRLHIRGESHPLGPDMGIYLPPGSDVELENTGAGPLRLVAVRVPDPSPGPPTPANIRRVDDQEVEQATTEREFRIVADPSTGLRSATHFVGYIPAERAPDHFHTYDEVLYILSGEGVLHIGDSHEPVAAGACIHFSPELVHSLENSGSEPMQVLGVFRPAGSPSEAYYPDGTRATY